MHILANFQKDTCHSGILTDRHVFLICDVKILNNIVQHTLGDLSVFTGAAPFDCLFDIRRQMLICLDAELLDHIGEHAHFYFTHFLPPVYAQQSSCGIFLSRTFFSIITGSPSLYNSK